MKFVQPKVAHIPAMPRTRRLDAQRHCRHAPPQLPPTSRWPSLDVRRLPVRHTRRCARSPSAPAPCMRDPAPTEPAHIGARWTAPDCAAAAAAVAACCRHRPRAAAATYPPGGDARRPAGRPPRRRRHGAAGPRRRPRRGGVGRYGRRAQPLRRRRRRARRGRRRRRRRRRQRRGRGGRSVGCHRRRGWRPP